MVFLGQIPECIKWHEIPILKHVKDSHEFNDLFVYALPAGHPGRTYDVIIMHLSLLLHFTDILCDITSYFRQEQTILTCRYSKSVPPEFNRPRVVRASARGVGGRGSIPDRVTPKT